MPQPYNTMKYAYHHHYHHTTVGLYQQIQVL